MVKRNVFQPDWISAPGETIVDILEERGLKRTEFGRLMGQPPERVEELMDARATITTDIAHRLEAVLGGSAAFWITRESQYRKDAARIQQDATTAVDYNWLGELPAKDMIKFGWLKPARGPAAQVRACLEFFGVADVNAWRLRYRSVLEKAAFRTSQAFESRPAAVAAWLRQGEIQAASIDCGPWNPARFQGLLPALRPLTRKKNPSDFLPELAKRCAECGVAVVIVRAPTGCRASGATRFLSPTKALLLLSFRYLSDDHFWFTFFHEAGHLLLHGQDTLFLEGTDTISAKDEQEANDLAGGVLIPSALDARLLGLPLNGREVIKFARLAGVSPGVVVGQLQYRKRIKPNQLNGLKRRFSWKHD